MEVYDVKVLMEELRRKGPSAIPKNGFAAAYNISLFVPRELRDVAECFIERKGFTRGDQPVLGVDLPGDRVEIHEHEITVSGTKYIVSKAENQALQKTLDDGKTGTMRYPLPAHADYIFFQPDMQDRFVKFPGGFADTSPLLPGWQGDRFAVQYMVPYSGQGSFDYTAPVNIKAMNFLLPGKSGIRLKGDGLEGPQPVTLEAGKSYEVYSLSDVRAGQTFHIALLGKPSAGGAVSTRDLRLPIGLAGGLLGLAMIAAAIWWWKRPQPSGKDEEMGPSTDPDSVELDGAIARIAQLDEGHERGEVQEDAYRQQRMKLREEAKKLLQRQVQ